MLSEVADEELCKHEDPGGSRHLLNNKSGFMMGKKQCVEASSDINTHRHMRKSVAIDSAMNQRSS